MFRLTIHNPDNDAHFMRVKPVKATVRVRRDGVLLAETRAALRVLETGRDVYDPVIYIPATDLTAELQTVEGKSTHCPLKGDASYLTLDGAEIAWIYDRPLPFADLIAGHVAFYREKVAIEEIGPDA